MLKFVGGVIDITDVPKQTRPVHWDEIAAELSEALGGTWTVAKLGRYWIVFDRMGTRGTYASDNVTSLAVALTHATGMPTRRIDQP